MGMKGDGTRLDRPRVLLLGDSIRMSYQPLVAGQMADRAEVVGPEDNGRWAAYTREHLPRWLALWGTPDIVHWNNGLWDCGHWSDRDPEQIPLEDYVTTLRQVLNDLRALTSSIIWATITPIDENRTRGQYGFNYSNAEIDTYNAAALALMAAEDVAVNDLHAIVSADLADNLDEDLLHLSEQGKQRCATAVTAAIDRLVQQPG